MKVSFWLAVTLAAAFTSLGELAYVRYWVGETVSEAVLFNDGRPQSFQIDVSENDLPVRLNFEMWGSRKTIDIAFLSLVTVAVGGPDGCGDHSFQAVINEDGDFSNPSTAFGNLTLRPGEVSNKAQATTLIECMSAGEWILSASVSEESGFSMQTINAVVKRNSRAVNWIVAGPGLGIMIVGFLFLVAALRRKYPHLAS